MATDPVSRGGLTLAGAAVRPLLGALTQGAVVRVHVLAVVAPDRYLVEILGHRVEASTSRSLVPGTAAAVRVQEVGRPIVLQWIEAAAPGAGRGAGAASAESAAYAALVARSREALGDLLLPARPLAAPPAGSPPPAEAQGAAPAPGTAATSWSTFRELLEGALAWLESVQGRALELLGKSEVLRQLRAWREAVAGQVRADAPAEGEEVADLREAREAAREDPTPVNVAKLLSRRDGAAWARAFDRIEAEFLGRQPEWARLRALASEWVAARDRWASGARETLTQSVEREGTFATGFASADGGGRIEVRVDRDGGDGRPPGGEGARVRVEATLSRLGRVQADLLPAWRPSAGARRPLVVTLLAAEEPARAALERDRPSLAQALSGIGWDASVRVASLAAAPSGIPDRGGLDVEA